MKSKKRRRSGEGINNSIVELASGIKELVSATIPYLTTLIGVLSKEESDLSTKMAEELYKIEGLSAQQRIKTGRSIISDSSMATLFYGDTSRKPKVFIGKDLWLS
ncbi:hypothetical protein Fot_19129 [Forsythia ovata]|uniref:Uncharacterized protein n=1 Tax=Forsythia ovata TaxID=205694 RepID=A0ABD1VM85_9LAMI